MNPIVIDTCSRTVNFHFPFFPFTFPTLFTLKYPSLPTLYFISIMLTLSLLLSTVTSPLNSFFIFKVGLSIPGRSPYTYLLRKSPFILSRNAYEFSLQFFSLPIIPKKSYNLLIKIKDSKKSTWHFYFKQLLLSNIPVTNII